MSLAPALCALLLCAGLSAAEDEKEKAPAKHEHEHSYFSHHSFGGSVQGLKPFNELDKALTGNTGYGIGLQWTHSHGGPWASRTRLEWNTFAEGDPVDPGQVKTYAKQYLLSGDRLFHLGSSPKAPYLMGGIGAVYWNLRHSSPTWSGSQYTTKLAFSAGLGWHFTRTFGLEARYVVSSINKTYDGNTAQVALDWQF